VRGGDGGLLLRAATRPTMRLAELKNEEQLD
jgi:hypothetical protein